MIIIAYRTDRPGGWYRPSGCSDLDDDSVSIVQTSQSFTGFCTQWEMIDLGDGYYRFKNRDTGKHFRPDNCAGATDETVNIVQAPETSVGDCTAWKLIPVSAINNSSNLNAQLSLEEESNLGPNLNFAPNPVRPGQTITVYLDEEMGEGALYDLNGQLIQEIHTAKNKRLEIKIGERVQRGIHLLRLWGENGTYSQKIVVE